MISFGTILVLITSFLIVRTAWKILYHFGGYDSKGQYRGLAYGFWVFLFTTAGVVGMILVLYFMAWFGNTHL